MTEQEIRDLIISSAKTLGLVCTINPAFVSAMARLPDEEALPKITEILGSEAARIPPGTWKKQRDAEEAEEKERRLVERIADAVVARLTPFVAPLSDQAVPPAPFPGDVQYAPAADRWFYRPDGRPTRAVERAFRPLPTKGKPDRMLELD